MPLLSIIVVTWNNENYIEQALRSCIFDGESGYEVVVVHNASSDRTGSVLRRVVDERPDIFRVIENDKNEGLGEARNIGVRNARGKYFMLLDGDDWYCANVPKTIIPVLKKEVPDVVVFNHARVWDDGEVRVNAYSNLLTHYDCSSVEDRLRVLDNFNVAWNKVYKKSFVDLHGLAFSRRLYEDIDWHFKVLALAESYYAINDVLIFYRQRSGSILRSKSEEHFDLVKQYEEVFRFLKENPEFLKIYGNAAYLHARKLLLNLIINQKRLPRKSEAKFLARTNQLLSAWRGEMGEGRRGLMLVLAGLKSPRILRAAELLRLARLRAAKKGRIYGKMVKKRVVSQLLYKVFCRLPMKDNLVLCEAYWGGKVDCNPRAIADGLRKKRDFEIVWSLSGKAKVSSGIPDGLRTVRKGSLAFVYTLARAKYLINNANFPTEYSKRQGQVFVQTKHGTPLKSMGLDIRKKNPKAMNWSDFAERCRRWDYVLSSNSYSSSVWRKGFPYSYKILEVGYPRNDVFFTTSPERIVELKKELGVPLDKKVALYAPTFRDGDRGKGIESGQSMFDPASICSALGEDYVLLIRSHYFNASGGFWSSSIIDVSDFPCTNDVLLISDLLITDYSSIMFDYACLQRPIILYQYDLEEYSESRGIYIDLHEVPPGPIVDNQRDLLEVLREKVYESAESKKKLEVFGKKFCPWEDGRATDRVIDEVFRDK
ncbi:bifunctional glycosyltransferase/CDP-glycerol:glycerophosphate glycerophosphotransferase [Halomonas sp. B23F22_10]|uniref:bifunctional glycosyltransferase/CDP-glycerol:glycerophosphate glycerophosphotransferase n=1 Tax=Halomonas sp. B23F22_10 TaxID=3459515 RepID=UPI00373EB452